MMKRSRSRTRVVAVVAGVLLAAAALNTPAATASVSTAPEQTRAARWTETQTPVPPAMRGAGAVWTGKFFLVFGGYLDGGSREAPAVGPFAFPSQRSRMAMLFNPTTGIWRPTADLPEAVRPLSVTSSGDKVYVLGVPRPYLDDTPPLLFQYDPGTGEWSLLPKPPVSDARLVDAGGHLVAVAQRRTPSRTRPDAVYNAKTREWNLLPEDPLGVGERRSMVWAGDRLVLASSTPRPADSDKPQYVRLATLNGGLTEGKWTSLASTRIISLRSHPVAVGRILVWPETDTVRSGDRTLPTGGIFDLHTKREAYIPPGLRGLRVDSTIPDGIRVGKGVTLSGSLLIPSSRQLYRLPAPPGSRALEAAFAGGGNLMLKYGGAREQQLIFRHRYPVNEAYLLRVQ